MSASDPAAASWPDRFRTAMPGLLVCVTVAMASAFISEHYGGPLMLYALLFGMAFNFLSVEGRCVAGIELSARSVLRIGVALLGARITWDEVMTLGWSAVALVVVGVAFTITAGGVLARLMGLSREQGLLSGGSVAICGASAAMALSAVMPRSPTLERNTILTVVCVTALSTVAMILYPMLAQALDFGTREAGLFLGATIHDVAQVVGAGYMMSTEVGDTSAVVKLMRVAMLVPAVLVFSLWLFRGPHLRGNNVLHNVALGLPGFLIAFVALVVVNSIGLVPTAVAGALADASRACLVTAIAALGMKTSLGQLAEVGWRPVLLILFETLLLCALVVAFLLLFT